MPEIRKFHVKAAHLNPKKAEETILFLPALIFPKTETNDVRI